MGRKSMSSALGVCVVLAACWPARGEEESDAESRQAILRTLGDVPLRLSDDDAQDAQQDPEKKQEDKKKDESPWLIAPVFSLNPKLGLSLGAIVGYMFYFDDKSKFSMIGINGQYTSTKSAIVMAVSKLSFGEDHHRFTGLFGGGNIRNDYDDFLGTGQPLKSNDELRALFGRYVYRIWGDWFLGGQAIYTNYTLIGDTALDDQVLNVLGLTGFRSAGLGPVLLHDSRDSETMPTKGIYINANDVSYREWLAGDNNFDVIRVDGRFFIPEGGGHVLALRQYNQFTIDAPSAAFAPVQLRGYKMGQYLGKNMSSIEGEERFRLGDKWTMTAFTGVAFLYGNGQSLNDPNTIYPNIGAGVQYVLKEKEGVVVNLEFAAGKRENYGVYIKLGYGF
jgi:hypothetical protein